MKSKKEKRKDKEICKDFYNKCRNYHRNLSKIEANRLKYDEIMNDMYGVSSVVMKDVIMENAGDPSHVWDHYLVEKKDELLLERAALLYVTVIVNKVLNNIADGEVVDMITECYIDRNKKHDDIAYNHNRSKPTMYSDMNRAVLSQLKK
ncbi:hypothetical protein MKC68_21750 [[Clostridium] innocuum]|nr:hypothetical protein [[Clostridium] innocuum]